MGIFQLPPSKCPCKDFSISLFLHPNNFGSRMMMKFFQNLKFRVYNSVSFLSHSVSMIMSRHFYRVIFSYLIPCQYEDTEFLFDCRIPCRLYHVNFNLLKLHLFTIGTSVPDSTSQAGQFFALKFPPNVHICSKTKCEETCSFGS